MSNIRKCTARGCNHEINLNKDTYYENTRTNLCDERPKYTNKYYYCKDCNDKNMEHYIVKGGADCILDHTTLVVNGKRYSGLDIKKKVWETVAFILKNTKDKATKENTDLEELKIIVTKFLTELTDDNKELHNLILDITVVILTKIMKCLELEEQNKEVSCSA